MALNYIWIAFFLIGFVVALSRLIFLGDTEIFPLIMQSTFDNAKTGFKLSLGLTGALTLWMGFMKVGEKGGMINVLAKLAGPFFCRIFPDLPKSHPAYGHMLMNFSANMLGLDNAATPMGLKAMTELQKTNPKKDTATNAMIMFLVLNTSGLTLIPVSVMALRATALAQNPSDVFMPILLATYFSTLAGIIIVSIYQRINLFNKVVLAYLGGITAVVLGLILWLSSLPKDQLEVVSSVLANFILFSVIIIFIAMAVRKKVNVYEAFIEGARDGFGVAVKIIPYLVAISFANLKLTPFGHKR